MTHSPTSMGRCRAVTMLASIALLWGAATTSAAVVSIDLGSEFLRVCLVKHGRNPISVVVNEMSRRKSPALVGFVNGERLLGEEAFGMGVRYPETIYTRARDLLGKTHDDPSIAAMMKGNLLPYEVVQDGARNVAAVRVDANTTVSAEELVASVLQYARRIVDEHAGGPIPDAVITVPAFFGQAQRQALSDAAALAGLNLLGLINTHTAAALQYGIERDFTNASETVILYDMGSGSTEVALVKFSTFSAKEGGKQKVYNQLEVKDVDWAPELGGNTLDALLADHFAAQFMAKFSIKEDIRGNAKAMAKLKRQVRRTKEMLSANSAAPFSVEELYEGIDFQSSITREEFESLAGDFFARAAEPLARIIARNNLTAADLSAVELLGGGSRVPKLQSLLSEALGGRVLDRHLDADEAVVLGAALFAANISSSFKLKKFGMADISMYGVQLQVNEIHEGLAIPSKIQPVPASKAAADGKGSPEILADGAGTGDSPEHNSVTRNLLPAGKKLPIRRVVHFNNLIADPLVVSLSYNTSTPTGLPPGVTSAELGTFSVSGIADVIKRYNSSGVVDLRFDADYSGLLRLERAEAVVEYTVMEEKIVSVVEDVKANVTITEAGAASGANETSKGEASSSDTPTPGTGAESATEDEESAEVTGDDESGDSQESAASSSADAEGNPGEEKDPGVKIPDLVANSTTNATTTNSTEGAKVGPATTVKRIMVPKIKTAKVVLTVGGSGWSHPRLGGPGLASSQAKLGAWVVAEDIKREVARSRNELESYIIKMKDSMEGDELLHKVTTLESRVAFTESLVEQEDWLYMEAGDDVPAQEMAKRLAALKAVGQPMVTRSQEFEARPAELERLRTEVDLDIKIANAWVDSKPWITEKERTDVVTKLEEFVTLLDNKTAAQAVKSDVEDPAFTVAELGSSWSNHERPFLTVGAKRKPKPPPEPKPEIKEGADSNSTATEGEGSDPTSSKDGKESNKSSSSTSSSSSDTKTSSGKKGDSKSSSSSSSSSSGGSSSSSSSSSSTPAGKKEAGKGAKGSSEKPQSSKPEDAPSMTEAQRKAFDKKVEEVKAKEKAKMKKDKLDKDKKEKAELKKGKESKEKERKEREKKAGGGKKTPPSSPASSGPKGKTGKGKAQETEL